MRLPHSLPSLSLSLCFMLRSVFLFTPHYLLSVYPTNVNARYKAVRGAADISTQAGSLETFELLARRAGRSGGGGGSHRGWFRTTGEKRGVVLGLDTGRAGERGGGAASRG